MSASNVHPYFVNNMSTNALNDYDSEAEDLEMPTSTFIGTKEAFLDQKMKKRASLKGDDLTKFDKRHGITANMDPSEIEDKIGEFFKEDEQSYKKYYADKRRKRKAAKARRTMNVPNKSHAVPVPSHLPVEQIESYTHVQMRPATGHNGHNMKQSRFQKLTRTMEQYMNGKHKNTPAANKVGTLLETLKTEYKQLKSKKEKYDKCKEFGQKFAMQTNPKP